MNDRNLNNIGDEIKDIVQNALNTKDFHQLNQDISKTVNSAINEVRDSFHMGSNVPPIAKPPRNSNQATYNNNHYNNTYNKAKNAYNYSQNTGRGNVYNQPYQSQSQYGLKKYASPLLSVPVGRVSGTLQTVFGVIGTSLFSIAILVLAIVAFATGIFTVMFSVIIGLLPLWVGSLLLTVNGGKVRKRLSRFQRYMSVFRGRKYCTLEDLSVQTGFTSKYIIKDLLTMVQKGMFPQGRFDQNKTCFMLDTETYQQYLQLEQQTKTKQSQPKAEPKETQSSTKADPAHMKIIADGKDYIRQIRRANDLIPGEEISLKLDRLEDVTNRIFTYIEVHPEQVPEIEKFLKYYLPTVVKLLDAYIQFDQQPIQGDNITTGKKEIEKTIDTINIAFERLLDSLFEAAAMDVSTDISVLQTLLAQEGLTGKDFQM